MISNTKSYRIQDPAILGIGQVRIICRLEEQKAKSGDETLSDASYRSLRKDELRWQLPGKKSCVTGPGMTRALTGCLKDDGEIASRLLFFWLLGKVLVFIEREEKESVFSSVTSLRQALVFLWKHNFIFQFVWPSLRSGPLSVKAQIVCAENMTCCGLEGGKGTEPGFLGKM